MSRPSRFAPAEGERTVRMMRDHTKDHASQRATIQSIAGNSGCTAETLRRWVREFERNAWERPGLSSKARERLEALEKHNRELQRASETFGKASAHLA